jgi:hypothetical protein
MRVEVLVAKEMEGGRMMRRVRSKFRQTMMRIYTVDLDDHVRLQHMANAKNPIAKTPIRGIHV